MLLLTKGLGVGVLSAAFKQERLAPAGYAALIASTTQLNRIGAELAGVAGVHGATDVTGFGLLGHTLEMCRGAGVSAEIKADAPILLDGVEALARAGVRTGASGRNWASYGEAVRLPEDFDDWRRDILCDPQTSGGLLIALAPEAVPQVMARLGELGATAAAVVGRIVEGPPEVRVI